MMDTRVPKIQLIGISFGSELTAARAEAEANRVDAERYRWLREVFDWDYCKGTSDYWRIVGESKTLSHEHQTLDAAIDAAKEGK